MKRSNPAVSRKYIALVLFVLLWVALPISSLISAGEFGVSLSRSSLPLGVLRSAANGAAVNPIRSNEIVNVSVGAMSTPATPTACPPLFVHIAQVIGSGSQKEVIGANASAIIAVVANLKPIRNRAVMDLPRNPMRVTHRFASAFLERPVAVSVLGGSPFPTAVRPLDFGPESFFKRGGFVDARHARNITNSVII